MSTLVNRTNALVGRRVVNTWMPKDKGVITGVLPGVNALVMVLFDGRDAEVHMVADDLTYEEEWPAEAGRVVIPEELNRNPK